MSSPAPPRRTALLPGLLLAIAVALLAYGAAAAQRRLFGGVPIEALVAAILIGIAVRTAWEPPRLFAPGVDVAAKQVLEVAVVLLGLSVDLPLLLRAGPALAAGIVLLVVVGVALGIAVGRALGLPPKLAVLVACGNAICGNSAIAAVAPVIRADREHVVSAVAFTALLGVVVVLGLPLLKPPLGLSDYQYGVLAGLTVYAVPQVLAAAFPVSALAGQVGTLVKLVRVLMLGPVVLFFALRERRHGARRARELGLDASPISLRRAVPWFVAGFLLLATLRAVGLVPDAWVAPARATSTALTVIAMAALGLGVDLAAVRRVGHTVVATASVSLLGLIVLGVLLIRGLGIR